MASRRPENPGKSRPTVAAEQTTQNRKGPRNPPRAPKAGLPNTPRQEISEDMRRSLIAQSAYLRAERRGFNGGDEVEDWLAAEAEVDALLRAGSSGAPQ